MEYGSFLVNYYSYYLRIIPDVCYAIDLVIFAGSDHHKLWRVLEITYIAVTSELLLPYVRETLASTDEPSVDGFWDWYNETQDPNYSYILQMTLTFLQSLMLLGNAVRKGNFPAITAAQQIFIPLLYARNHRRYQSILARDI